NELNVAVTSNIQIQFSENIDAGTIDENTFNVDGSVTGQISGIYAISNENVTFDPDNDFKNGEIITITLTSGIKDINGKSLLNPFSWQFIIETENGCGNYQYIPGTDDIVITINPKFPISPFRVKGGDIDGDSDIDVICAFSGGIGSSKISWCENGNSWNETVILNYIPRVVEILAVDIDNDGDLDVVSANNMPVTIRWFENGNSWNETTITSSLTRLYDIFAADIDGDGDQDIIAAFGEENTVAWYENGNSWNETIITTTAQGASALFAADIDNDGDLDVLCASSLDNKVAWYENGNSWNETIITTNNPSALGIFAADIDNDGDIDVISNSGTDNKLFWYENGNSWNETIVSNSAKYEKDILATDVDGDGDLDIVSYSSDNIRWYENGNSWSENAISSFGKTINAIDATDIDGDGDADLLVSINRDKIVKYPNYCLDYGDAPQVTPKPEEYPTLLANNGPRHEISSDLYLGSLIDSESDGQRTANADGDDTDADGDDEDGIDPAQLEISEGMIPVIDVNVVNNTGNTATVKGWIDYDGDGDFDAGESATSTTSASGVVSLTFPQVPTGAASATFARFRVSTDASSLTGPGGFSMNGEVEDYQVTITLPPDVDVTKDDTLITDNDGDGLADPGDQIRYTTVVTNTGDGDGKNAVFSDTPDANTTLVTGSVSSTQGTVTSGNGAGDTKVEVNIGTLLNTTGVDTITFDVTVNSSIPANITHLCNQGLVSGSNFDDEITDDPDTAPYEDSTCTEVDDDFDDDGVKNAEEGDADRDGDGIPDHQDYDPSGWIYNEDNGDIISGGTISVSPSAGVNIIQDGSSGYYQFTISQNGDYTLSYNPPSGFNLSSTCSEQSGKLDPDPATDPNPYVVGAGSKDGTSNKMTNWNCGDNPYYWDFHLEVGDPVIINNNIPLHPQPTNITLSYFTAELDQNGILIQWGTETEPDNAGFNIFRSQQENGEYSKVNDNLIPAQGNATTGTNYTYLDSPEQSGNYFYKLQSTALTGQNTFYGPISIILTSANINKNTIPDNYALSQNYPNPFNPETSIEYALPEPAQVTLSIYDINGHLVRKLVSGKQAAGVHLAIWDGRDNAGAKVVSGIYFYHFKAVSKNQIFSKTNKMILMK
ncbi:MAG: T9SS type A sorting domain-containing protein, partial [Calditrichaeota bacterium]|nr:T9SS type A sorting domain-containing protein [Calditrichota bacterium]